MRPLRQVIAEWLEVRGFTTSGILKVPHILGFYAGFLYDWIGVADPPPEVIRRSGLRARTLPAYLGGLAFSLLVLLVMTGIVLSFSYRPSPGDAHRSMLYISGEATFGWLLRQAHAWAAHLLLVVLLAHLLRTFWVGAYRPPRELNWIVGVLLLLLAAASAVTGGLLPWDQAAYLRTQAHLEIVRAIPLIGTSLVGMLTGAGDVSGITLTRFYALHIQLLPWLLFLLLSLHLYLLRRQGLASEEA